MKIYYIFIGKIFLCAMIMHSLSYGVTFQQAFDRIFIEAVRQNDFKQMNKIFHDPDVSSMHHYHLFHNSSCNADCVRALKGLGATAYLKGGCYEAEMSAAAHLDDEKIKALVDHYPGVSTYNQCYAGNTPSHVVAAQVKDIILDDEASQKAFNILVDLRLNIESKNHNNVTPRAILLGGLFTVCSSDKQFKAYNPEACTRYAQFLFELEGVLCNKSLDKSNV